jgi:hypothetical protein
MVVIGILEDLVHFVFSGVLVFGVMTSTLCLLHFFVNGFGVFKGRLDLRERYVANFNTS